jgi:hypothetical protein
MRAFKMDYSLGDFNAYPIGVMQIFMPKSRIILPRARAPFDRSLDTPHIARHYPIKASTLGF